jgi:hypothetical protein
VISRRDGHLLWVGGPVPPGADAITLGPLVSVRRACAGDDHLLAHEAAHVEQWRRLGVFGFLRRYVGAYCWLRVRGYGHWGAYRRIPLEVEAEWTARRGDHKNMS